MNLTNRRYFEQVSVEDELPNFHTRHFVITKQPNGLISERQSTYVPNGWIKDNKFSGEEVTHWLKSTEGILLSKSEIIELITEGMIGISMHPNFTKEEIMFFIASYLKSKSLTNPSQEVKQ